MRDIETDVSALDLLSADAEESAPPIEAGIFGCDYPWITTTCGETWAA